MQWVVPMSKSLACFECTTIALRTGSLNGTFKTTLTATARVGRSQVVETYRQNYTYGLMLRFQACTQAAHEWVIIQDDDIMLSQAGMQALMLGKAHDADRLYSFFGRGWNTHRVV